MGKLLSAGNVMSNDLALFSRALGQRCAVQSEITDVYCPLANSTRGDTAQKSTHPSTPLCSPPTLSLGVCALFLSALLSLGAAKKYMYLFIYLF